MGVGGAAVAERQRILPQIEKIGNLASGAQPLERLAREGAAFAFGIKAAGNDKEGPGKS